MIITPSYRFKEEKKAIKSIELISPTTRLIFFTLKVIYHIELRTTKTVPSRLYIASLILYTMYYQ